MELTREVQSLLEHITLKMNAPSSNQTKMQLPAGSLSLGELAQLLSILANEYGTTLPVLIRKLDRVSGDVRVLDQVFTQKDEKLEWTPEEDDLLTKNPGLLTRWKGEEAVTLRKQYLSTKLR
jgi:hypothetical protein